MEENEEQKNTQQTPIEKFNDDLKDYLATRYELTLLKTSQKASIIASVATLGAIIAILGVLFILFISLALGFWLSDILHSYTLGFLSLSGFFFLVGLIIFLARKKWILHPVRNYIIKEMYDED